MAYWRVYGEVDRFTECGKRWPTEMRQLFVPAPIAGDNSC
jgi:hypothetical protein